MANKNSNVPYDQLPHIVVNHPETDPYHESLMRALFKILKDKPKCIYTNEQLAIDCKMSLRNVERKLPELCKMGFLTITGRSYNRRISLGLLFITSANLAVKTVQKLNTTAKDEITTAKYAAHNRQIGGYTKPSTKPSTKCDLSFSDLKHDERREIEYCLENGFTLADEYKYLESVLVDRKKQLEEIN